MMRRLSSTAAAAVVLAAALAGCAPDPAGPPPPASSSPPENPSGSGTTPTGELTCESMISAGTVEALAAEGWSAQKKEFVVGGVELPDGLLCFWADYTVGSDHGQLYGWSPITDAEAAKAEATLIAEGWTREEGSDGVYVTEDPQFAMGTDDDGYGMTYLFGDGWVRLADTRQGLILIEWPR